jgi:ABC-type oligopeptide transport system ATPase subunit
MKYLESYNEFVNENLLTKEDIKHNYEDWENGKSNVLFVCGYSGSGKSTFAKEEAKKKGAIYVEMDRFYNTVGADKGKKTVYSDDINSNLWQKYYKISKFKKFFQPNGFIKDEVWNNKDLISKIYEEFFLFRVNYAKKDKTNKYVLEGIQFVFYKQYWKLFGKFPILIMGTGAIKSSIKAAKRDYEYFQKWKDDSDFGGRSFFFFLYDSFKSNFKNINKKLNQFKKHLNNVNRN